jgi:hypothetical protein
MASAGGVADQAMIILFAIFVLGLMGWLAVRLINEVRNPSWRLWVIFPAFLLLAFGLLLVGATAYVFRQRPARTITEPAAEFTQCTGLPFPQSAKLVSGSDDHGTVPMSSEGELFIVYDISSEDVDRLLKGPAPWGASDWQSGPVPGKIGFHCRFGTAGVAAASSGSEPDGYIGDPQLMNLLGSARVRYAADERCCESLRWHNGRLLVVDPINKRVWLSVWDL